MTMLTSQKISDFVIEALERTAFVLAEAIDAGQATSLPAPTNFARISYIGPSCGYVYLAASEGFIRELAASILGVEPEDIDPSNEGEDAITELANIVGGSVTLELGGEKCEYSLRLPELIEASELPKTDNNTQVCYVESEGELLKVIWQPNDSAASAAA